MKKSRTTMMKCPTWAGLRKVVDLASEKDLGPEYYRHHVLADYIRQWPAEQRLAVALALSVAHWSHEAREQFNDAGRDKNTDETFHAGCRTCGLCVLNSNNCSHCVLEQAGRGCLNPDSIYDGIDTAVDDGEGFHAAADKMLAVLNELYRIEWEKL